MSYFRTCYKCGKGTMVRYATDEAICSECFDKEEKMDLKHIEAVGVIVQDGNDHGLIESEVIQGISTLPVGTKIYTAEQMQEYAKSKVKELLFEQLWNDKLYANSKIFFEKEVEKVYNELFKEAQDENQERT